MTFLCYDSFVFYIYILYDCSKYHPYLKHIFPDLQVDNTMTWWDGSPISYSQWDGDYTQLVTFGVDDCAWMYTGKSMFCIDHFACLNIVLLLFYVSDLLIVLQQVTIGRLEIVSSYLRLVVK